MALLGRRVIAASSLRLWTILVLTGPALPTAFAGEDTQWRIVAASNLVVVELAEGRVFLELNPDFAPRTVEQFKSLVRKRFYDGSSFYRVIDGFVAQGGDGSDLGEANAEPEIPAEFERSWSDSLHYTHVQSPDLSAPETGFVDGFAVGRDPEAGTTWLAHCPGTVAMARGNPPDSSSTDFYIVIGQAPRYLDRNMNVFGRVVHGMDAVQRIRRGDADKNGVIDDSARRSKIRRIRIAEDIDPEAGIDVQVMDTSSAGFQQLLQRRRDRQSGFFHAKPPSVLDVCQVPNTGRRSVAEGEGPALGESDYAAAERLDNTNLAALVKNATVQPHWLNDGKRFWYMRDDDEGRSVVLVDVEVGTPGAAFTIDKRIVCETDGPECPFSDEPAVDPQLLVAPAKERAAFVRNHNLWLRNLTDGSETALTTDGERYAAYASSTDQAQFRRSLPGPVSRPESTHWSPTGQWIITRRIDERDVELYPFLEAVPADGGFRPRVKEARVVILGDSNDYKIQDYIIDVGAKSRVEIQLPDGVDLYDPFPGNAPLGWSEDGSKCYLYASSADAKLGKLIEVNLQTGKSRVVLTEHAANSRVYLGSFGSAPMVRILGDELIWYSERSNYGHLYLYDTKTGGLKRQLTEGKGAVSEILHVDTERRSVLILKSRADEGLDPYQQYVYRIDLDGGKPVLLTPEVGHHDISSSKVAPDGTYFVDSLSTISNPPRTQLRLARDPKNVVDLEVADASGLFETGWRPPQRLRVKAADGETVLYAAWYRADARFKHWGPLPVIDLNYINSIVSVVPVAFMDAVQLPWPTGVTRLGFHVVVVDGRGTPGRSRDFREAGYPAFADIQIEDHVAAINELAKRFPELDAERVGIWGSSNGGAGAARAILRRPDFFDAAVAAAGSHDYMSLPPSGVKFFGIPEYSDGSAVRPTTDAVPENYRSFDNAALAANLKGDLLLAYGDMDNLALPSATHRLANALIESEKTFDMLHMPNRGHFLLFEPYFKRRLRNYFVEHLHGIEPPN